MCVECGVCECGVWGVCVGCGVCGRVVFGPLLHN